MLLRKERLPTAQNKNKVCSKMLCNPTTQLRGWVLLLQKTTNTLRSQHHNCFRDQLKVQNSVTMSRGEEGFKKIVHVTSGKVEQCSARPATPLVADKNHSTTCVDTQPVSKSNDVDIAGVDSEESQLPFTTKDVAMVGVYSEERVDLCSARTAKPSHAKPMDKNISTNPSHVGQSKEGDTEAYCKTKGNAMDDTTDNPCGDERNGSRNSEERVEECSAPTALPSPGPPKEKEEPPSAGT